MADAQISDPSGKTPYATNGLPLLVLAGLPLVVWAVGDDPATRLSAIVVMGLLATALWFIAEGQRRQRLCALSGGAHRPRLPRKLIGAALIGCGVLILAGYRFDTLWTPLVLGAVGFALSVVAFGTDPLPRLRRPAPPRVRRAKILSDIETVLAAAEARIATLDDPVLRLRITGFADALVARLHRVARGRASVRDGLEPLLQCLADDLEAALVRLEASGPGKSANTRFLATLDRLQNDTEAALAALRHDGKAARTPSAQSDRPQSIAA